MAAQEMQEITIDDFTEEVWGSANPPFNKAALHSKLFFYFGQSDHWVADRTRDSLIADRAFVSREALLTRRDWTKDSRPWMEIDQFNTRHSFCIGRLIHESWLLFFLVFLGIIADRSKGASDLVAAKVSEYMLSVL